MATFPSTVTPHKVVAIGREFKTHIITMENEYNQRFALRENPIQTYRLEWTVLTAAELATLQTFFDTHLGALKFWDITDARINGGSLINLRFKSDKLNIRPIKAGFYRADVEVTNC